MALKWLNGIKSTFLTEYHSLKWPLTSSTDVPVVMEMLVLNEDTKIMTHSFPWIYLEIFKI